MASRNKQIIRNIILEEGFDSIAITSALPDKNVTRNLNHFLNKGYHGEMDWLLNTRSQRTDPKKLMKTVKSIIVLGTNYTPHVKPSENLKIPSCGTISCFSQTAQDYHKVVKKSLLKIIIN